MSDPKLTENSDWEKTRDSANKSDISDTPALKTDALTSKDGDSDVSLDDINGE